jgi:hypothetical protein
MIHKINSIYLCLSHATFSTMRSRRRQGVIQNKDMYICSWQNNSSSTWWSPETLERDEWNAAFAMVTRWESHLQKSFFPSWNGGWQWKCPVMCHPNYCPALQTDSFSCSLRWRHRDKRGTRVWWLSWPSLPASTLGVYLLVSLLLILLLQINYL